MRSLAELAAKAHSDTWGWFRAASSTSRGPVILVAKILAEILAVVPLGLMLARRNATRKLPATRHAVLYGILLGLAIEAVQFFMFSGISQGASLLTRAAGIYGGARLWRQQMLLRDLHLHARSRRLIFSLSLFYLLALVAVNGFFDHSWHGVELAGKTLAETRFLPFYYHYYTTEQAALLSLLSVVMMYAPVGVLAWLCWWPPAMAFWAAALTATSIESSKLFPVSYTHLSCAGSSRRRYAVSCPTKSLPKRKRASDCLLAFGRHAIRRYVNSPRIR